MVLIKRVVLDRIVAGDVDLIFRRWRKPTVKTGGQLRTSVGMLNIVAVDKLVRSRITPAEARRAGYPTKAALSGDLDARREGEIYRIEVRLGGEDPRIALRNSANLSADDIADVTTRLERLDRVSKTGPWTAQYLGLLQVNPSVRAQDLADGIGLDKPAFKNNVRKLKELGLTISHSPGCELSPRGLAFVALFDA